MLIKLKRLLIAFMAFTMTLNVTLSAPKSWPYMKSYDIWDSQSNKVQTHRHQQSTSTVVRDNLINDGNSTTMKGRKAKVINFFTNPIDEECLSNDGRRTGICMNVYECRMSGGTSRGDCALGFGACCVFEASCGDTVHNNITYFTSPKFPALMPFKFFKDKDSCSLKIKTVNNNIGQLRLDFVHFSLSQPNRFTGHCDSDMFSLVGGSLPFNLCGQNSGQHVFYDVPSKRMFGNDELEINVKFNKFSLSSRLWEIKITQIPFSYKSPSGCMQYHTGVEGMIQTFNFADNGRHLANQDYKSCVRQEEGFCSIQYEPCNEQSFRIGPIIPIIIRGGPAFNNFGQPNRPNLPNLPNLPNQPNAQNPPNVNLNFNNNGQLPQLPNLPQLPQGQPGLPQNDPTVQLDPSALNDAITAAGTNATEGTDSDPTLDDELVEGSGGGEGGVAPSATPIAAAAATSSESFFDLTSFPFPFPSFFRSLSSGWGFGREGRSIKNVAKSRRARAKARQAQTPPYQKLYSTCTDRITMPCVVEDFIDMGYGEEVQSCSPVHCGGSLCRPGEATCKVETDVKPFHIGIHFGNGTENKGGPEDNIGACLRYKQIPC